MADATGFLKIKRKEAGNRPLHERICDFSEVEQVLNSEDRMLLDEHDKYIPMFIKVVPYDYKKVLQEQELEELRKKIADVEMDVEYDPKS